MEEFAHVVRDGLIIIIIVINCRWFVRIFFFFSVFVA